MMVYGAAIWAAVFVVAMLVFPLRANERPLFESIMPVALAAATAVASVKYFSTVSGKYRQTGWRLGVVWLGVNLALDSLMFSWGPMKMTLGYYLKDIGVTYLMIPVIPAAIGYALEGKEAKR